MPAKSVKFSVDGKEYTAREFTLADYPDADKFFHDLAGDTIQRRDAMVGLLGLAVGIEREAALAFTLDEALEILNRVLEVNGRLPKAEAPVQEAPAAP